MQLSEIPAQKKIAREYELVYILTPQVDPDEADRIATRLQEVVSRLNGKITKVDQWGRRRLAYPINKMTRGVFVCVRMVGYSDLVADEKGESDTGTDEPGEQADRVANDPSVKADTPAEAEELTAEPGA